MKDTNHIGEAVKRVRKLKKLKQKDFAKQIKISTSSLSAIEQGARVPSLRMLQKIADGFKISLPILLWFSVKREDVEEDKRETFDILMPQINSMISSLFNTK
jgi:transcriptional regulator with XRE-family HTH domain